MLSVLIPTYNYNIFPLVEKIHGLFTRENIGFEIICLDDGSGNEEINKKNHQINAFSNSSFSELEKNIGRSSIRNLLAKKASYDWLLFLDADVIPKQNDFITEYLKYLNSDFDVIYGGIEYQKEKPDASQILRWKYGKEREALSAEVRNKKPYISFLTLNFIIRKKIFEQVQFNENIPNLRHEDTLFSFNLKEKHVKIHHIENPVYHLGLETSELFLKKSVESVEAALFLEEKNLIEPNYIKVLSFYRKMETWHLLNFINAFGSVFQNGIKKNLLGENPSLRLYDFYRLNYLQKLKNA